MEKQIEYRGYEIIATHNKKIVAQIKNNKHKSERIGYETMQHEPPIRFIFSNYNTMESFINENPR